MRKRFFEEIDDSCKQNFPLRDLASCSITDLSVADIQTISQIHDLST